MLPYDQTRIQITSPGVRPINVKVGLKSGAGPSSQSINDKDPQEPE